MNIKKYKLNMFKAIYMAMRPHLKDILTEKQLIILHLYLMENNGLIEIAEKMNFSDYHIIKEELKIIELRILALG